MEEHIVILLIVDFSTGNSVFLSLTYFKALIQANNISSCYKLKRLFSMRYCCSRKLIGLPKHLGYAQAGERRYTSPWCGQEDISGQEWGEENA
jgi:DNA-directed RNA polymerase subunit N (RpoN/RPB10)